MEYVRTVTEPIKQVSLGERMKGWWDDYKDISEEVLLLEGETHYQRKPVRCRPSSFCVAAYLTSSFCARARSVSHRRLPGRTLPG